MRTSVIVVLHGGARSAEQCLAALAVQDEPVTEVVLVRSATTPPPLPPDGGPVVRTVILPSWTGPHAARNVGVGESSGDFIAFVDADCVPERSWHRRLVAPLAGRTADLVGGAVACGDRRWIDRGAHRAKFGVWAPGSSARDRPSYPTANLALGRRTWDQVGPFRVVGWSGDTEFVWRARALGARTAFVSDAIVHHRQNVRLRALWRERHERGDAFARVRLASGWHPGGRWPTLARAPAVPLLLVGRSLRVAASAGELGDAVSTLPVQLLAQAAWVAGETAAIVRRG